MPRRLFWHQVCLFLCCLCRAVGDRCFDVAWQIRMIVFTQALFFQVWDVHVIASLIVLLFDHSARAFWRSVSTYLRFKNLRSERSVPSESFLFRRPSLVFCNILYSLHEALIWYIVALVRSTAFQHVPTTTHGNCWPVPRFLFSPSQKWIPRFRAHSANPFTNT